MKTLADYLNEAISQFEAGGPIDLTTTPLDILFAYRLLLSRNPDTNSLDDLMRRSGEFPSAQDLMRGFLVSNEFRDRYYGQAQRPEGRVVLVRDDNRRIAVHLDDMAISWNIINGTYEPEMRWLMRNMIQPGQTCLDLGANVGFFTVFMADLVGPEGHVYAFEPFPTVFNLLTQTVHESGLDNRVTLRNKACSNEEQSTTLRFATQSDNFGGSFLSEEDQPCDSGLTTISVATTTIDKELAALDRRVAFIKMDVEGAEFKVMQGMTKLLHKHRPSLVMEVNPDALLRQKATVGEVLGFLAEHRYQAHMLSSLLKEEPGLVSVTEGEQFPEHSYDNILCVPEEEAEATIPRLQRNVANWESA